MIRKIKYTIIWLSQFQVSNFEHATQLHYGPMISPQHNKTKYNKTRRTFSVTYSTRKCIRLGPPHLYLWQSLRMRRHVCTQLPICNISGWLLIDFVIMLRSDCRWINAAILSHVMAIWHIAYIIIYAHGFVAFCFVDGIFFFLCRQILGG